MNKDLYAFKYGNPVSAYKITDFSSSEHLVKTTLSPLPSDEMLVDFSVCTFAGNIVLSGGRRGMFEFKQTYLMDMETDRWQEEPFPDLNVARYLHASFGHGQQVYVACG